MCFSAMDPPLTPKPSPSASPTLRPDLSSQSSSSSSPVTSNSNYTKPRLKMPTPPTTTSPSPSTASPRTSSALFSRSSSLSTPPPSPLRQPIRSPSQVGRSQLNAATESPSSDVTAAGTATKATQPPPAPEPGENPALPFWLLALQVTKSSPSSFTFIFPPTRADTTLTILCVLLCLQDSHGLYHHM